MPADLAEVIRNGRPAVLTMELQRGVVGDLSTMPELAEAVAKDKVIENAARLCGAARARGVPVVHCTAGFRADRRGSPTNAPLIASLLRRPDHLREGTAAVEVVPELGPFETDLVSHRRHGVSPFTGTDLDATLAERDVTVVVATGVSLNVAILGLAIEAVNLGYKVVVPTDAVTGIPSSYASAVVQNTLRPLAHLTRVDELIACL